MYPELWKKVNIDMGMGSGEFALDTLNLRFPFLIQLNWVGRQVFDLRVERSQLGHVTACMTRSRNTGHLESEDRLSLPTDLSAKVINKEWPPRSEKQGSGLEIKCTK